MRCDSLVECTVLTVFDSCTVHCNGVDGYDLTVRDHQYMVLLDPTLPAPSVLSSTLGFCDYLEPTDILYKESACPVLL